MKLTKEWQARLDAIPAAKGWNATIAEIEKVIAKLMSQWGLRPSCPVYVRTEWTDDHGRVNRLTTVGNALDELRGYIAEGGGTDRWVFRFGECVDSVGSVFFARIGGKKALLIALTDTYVDDDEANDV